MKRIRQGWNTLRRSRRSGVSLIVALCAVAVLIGLSLSIVYSSSMLLSRANRKIGRERCYQLPIMPKHIAHRVLDKALYLRNCICAWQDDGKKTLCRRHEYLHQYHFIHLLPPPTAVTLYMLPP